MTTTTHLNSETALYHFALQFSYNGDVKFATECASDYLDTINDINEFEKKLAFFLAGKSQVVVDRMNEDGSWRSEVVKVCIQTGLPCGFPCNGLENCNKKVA